MMEWTLRKPFVVIAIILAITLFFVWQIRNLSFKTSIYDLQIEDLPETTRYEDFKKLFGSDEIIRIVLKAENIFDSATYIKIEKLVEQAAQIDGVRRVISLPGIKKAVDVTGNWDMEKFQAVVMEVDLFKDNLFSADGKATALTLVLKNEALPENVIHDVRLLIADTSADLSPYQIGMPLVSEALAKFTEKDFTRLPPITFLLIAMVLFCLFRKLRYIFIPLTCVGLALTWTFGFMALLGIPLSMLTMIVPVFLIAVGTAHCLPGRIRFPCGCDHPDFFLYRFPDFFGGVDNHYRPGVSIHKPHYHDSGICPVLMLRHGQYIDYCAHFSSGGHVAFAGSRKSPEEKGRYFASV